MFRNILAATLANLARNRLYAAISILSLAVGMVTVLVTGLYLRDETAFDGGVPGVDRVYVVVSDYRLGAGKPRVVDNTVPSLGTQLKLDFSEVRRTARVSQSTAGVRRGETTAIETVGWTDPDLFAFLRAPALAGDPAAVLTQPDGAVITRTMARKYFGKNAPLGESFEVNGAGMFQVGAVLEDPPANSNLAQPIFVSNLNAASPIHAAEARFKPRSDYFGCCRTYVEIPDAAAAARVRAGLPDFFVRRLGFPGGKLKNGAAVRLDLVPLTRLHLYPLNGFSTLGVGVPQGDWGTVWTLGCVATAVLIAAAINFVNLMTARAARRAVEVGVRKTAGARRRDLLLQFVGEAVIYALIALVIAVAALELLLPSARALLDRPLRLDYRHEPALLAMGLGLSLLVGVLAGVYPALVQSSFSPSAVLKGVLPRTSGSGAVRGGLISLQFAALIGLVLAVVVIGRQTGFTLGEGLNLNTSGLLTLSLNQPARADARHSVSSTTPCRSAFPDRVRGLPGVVGAACLSATTLDNGDLTTPVPRPDGTTLSVLRSYVDFGFFELVGLKPAAGRFFSREHIGDETPQDGPPPHTPRRVVINQLMVRALGFVSPEQAVGRSFKADGLGPGAVDLQIIGVVPDFALDLFDRGKRPRFYAVDPSSSSTLGIMLSGRDVGGTLRAIDGLWKQASGGFPPSRRFVDDYVQSLYRATIQQGFMLDALCAVAVLLAALGLFALAAFTAERRTKEIGIRKAMGASSPDIVRLLLWSFTQPVLWANLIAWPVGWWAMSRWLEGFARHIELSPLYFLAAGAAALLIAALTVCAHAIRVAWAKPVGALRYE